MDGGPIVIQVPVRQKTVRVNGQDVTGIHFIGDFWEAVYGDSEIHPVSNMIQEWFWINFNTIPDVVFVLQGDRPIDDEIVAGESAAAQVNNSNQG